MHSRLPLSLFAPATAIAVLLSGCASTPAAQHAGTDPWERMNRSLYNANVALDEITLKPLAHGYEKITPAPVRNGVSNFFDNLRTPGSVLNNFLQGKPKRGFSETLRFVFNSTLGFAGFFDIATASGLEDYAEDFGQTAAVWGIPDGPYVMLPFLGPYTLRDAIFLPLDVLANPLYAYENSSLRDKLYGVRAIDLRHSLIAVENLLDDSIDPYITLRESYLQNRKYEVYDGDPPIDDAFFDDVLEDD